MLIAGNSGKIMADIAQFIKWLEFVSSSASAFYLFMPGENLCTVHMHTCSSSIRCPSLDLQLMFWS